MRSIAPEEGLTRNVRLRKLALGERTVRVQKLSNSREYTIHRIIFKHKLPFGRTFTMIRKQLPLTLADAMTVNKSQGQTLAKVLLDLRSPCFSHGHLYVGLARIRAPNNILLYGNEDQIQNHSFASIINVVLKELLFDA